MIDLKTRETIEFNYLNEVVVFVALVKPIENVNT